MKTFVYIVSMMAALLLGACESDSGVPIEFCPEAESAVKNGMEFGSDAFATNGRLSLLVLPANLQEISPKAFRRCHVDSLYLSWETPPMVDLVPDAKNVFVLQGTKTLYEETPCWNKYTNISELDGDWEGISK